MTPRTVHLAVLDTMADWEVGHLTAHLRNGLHQVEPGAFRVATVGLTLDPVTTMGGLRVLPDLALADLAPADSAMLVLPGAETWEAGGAAFVAAARDFLAAGVPVAAVCGATFALAAAGLLDDVAHTSNDPAYLAASGYAGAAHYVAEPAVVAGDLVTASGVAPVHFARAVFSRLGSHSPGVLDSWTRLHADRDPAAFYELDVRVSANQSLLSEAALLGFRLNGQLLALAEDLAAPVGLTAARWQVLGAVLPAPMSVAGIAREMGMARQSVQRTADLLVYDGLAAYADNPAHKRAKLLAPTDAGLAAVRRIGPQHAVAAEALAGALGPDRFAACVDALRDLSVALEKVSVEEAAPWTKSD